ncbi:MAG TPA: hypothetical protein VGA88_14045 [Burkholderiales bacterium]
MFLSVQAIALAHEIKHDLRQHDDGACVLHLHAKHAGDGLAAGTQAPAVVLSAQQFSPGAPAIVRGAPTLGYRTRAPPVIA